MASMVPQGTGFGSNENVTTLSFLDSLFREITGSFKRIDVLSVGVEYGPELYVLAPVATAPQFFAVTLAILRGASAQTPPQPTFSGGFLQTYHQVELNGYEKLWEETVFLGAGSKPGPLKFLPGEMSVIGNKSLYIVMTAIARITPSSAAGAGGIDYPSTSRGISVSGYDFNSNFNNNPEQDKSQRSLPRYAEANGAY